jgi:hypothetical protein
MKDSKIREKIYEFIVMYVDTPEPKKLCSSIQDLVDELTESKVKNLILSDVGSSGSEFEKDLFKLINNYCKNGLKKPELVKKMEWVLGSCKMS